MLSLLFIAPGIISDINILLVSKSGIADQLAFHNQNHNDHKKIISHHQQMMHGRVVEWNGPPQALDAYNFSSCEACE